jgi:peptidoglycan/xylan/chitin deacetylase (PgdA/CDA1 family)
MRVAATLITVMVIAAGLAIVSPLFLPLNSEVKQKVMLCFDVLETENSVQWCQNISNILKSKNLPASIFILGKVANQTPSCTTVFNGKVDVGCKTYNKVALASIDDYSVKLQEIEDGKAAVDEAGKLDVKSFRAANGEVDDDIYSLLNRCGVLADFSYKDHYNIYENGQFVRYNASVYDGNTYSASFFLNHAKSSEPIIICFDSSDSTVRVADFLSKLQSDDLVFVNASDLAGSPLTGRR